MNWSVHIFSELQVSSLFKSLHALAYFKIIVFVVKALRFTVIEKLMRQVSKYISIEGDKVVIVYWSNDLFKNWTVLLRNIASHLHDNVHFIYLFA